MRLKFFRAAALIGYAVSFELNRHNRGSDRNRKCITINANLDCTTPANTTLGFGEIFANNVSIFDFVCGEGKPKFTFCRYSSNSLLRSGDETKMFSVADFVTKLYAST